MGHDGEDGAKPLDAVIADHADELLAMPDVVGVGAGSVDGRPVIEVLVETDPDAIQDRLPSELAGYPLHVARTGRISRLEAEPGGE